MKSESNTLARTACPSAAPLFLRSRIDVAKNLESLLVACHFQVTLSTISRRSISYPRSHSYLLRHSIFALTTIALGIAMTAPGELSRMGA
jgi:hypothetical protein